MSARSWFREEVRSVVFIALGALLVTLGVTLHRLEPPGGYLALELPAFDQLQTMPVSSWNPEEREVAFLGLGLDVAFLLVYPLFLSLLLGSAAATWRLPSWCERSCRRSASIVLFAAPADLLENVGIFLLLWSRNSRAVDLTTTAFSLVKWTLILAALLVLLLAFVARATRSKGAG